MKAVATVLLVCMAVACGGIPRDPEGTLDRVRGGVLRVGFTDAPPFAEGPDDDPAGVEVELVKQFAEELGASVEWVKGAEAELFEALEVRALDLVIGGYSSSDPWVASVGVTRPYATTRLTVGVPEGQPPPDDLAGMTIAVERGSEAHGLVVAAGATPEVVDDITTANGPAAVDEWLLDDLGLTDSQHYLAETKHVLGAPLGENAFLVELERFLFRERDAIRAAIGEASE